MDRLFTDDPVIVPKATMSSASATVSVTGNQRRGNVVPSSDSDSDVDNREKQKTPCKKKTHSGF